MIIFKRTYEIIRKLINIFKNLKKEIEDRIEAIFLQVERFEKGFLNLYLNIKSKIIKTRIFKKQKKIH